MTRDMERRIDLRFRPSLIIFVDETGERIRHHFKAIVRMTSLDPTLHQSVALLQVISGSDRAAPFPIGEQFPADDDIPSEPGPLEQLIASTVTNIRLERRVQEIISAGYYVHSRPQIYIVGDANSTWLANVLQGVQEQLASSGLNTLVCYILSAYQRMQYATPFSSPFQQGDPLASLGGASYWAMREVTNFCYLYENMLYPALTSVTEAESHYASAEALFTLISTGITPEPIFEQQMRLSPNLNTYENVGSLSTSLIVFPRDALLTYCSSRLGIALMTQWLKDLDDEILSEEIRKKQQQRARNDAEDIEQWIKDIPLRPFANGIKQSRQGNGQRVLDADHTWPSLAILVQPDHPVSARALNEQKVLYRRLREQTGALFKLFWSEDIDKEYKKQKRRADTWTKLVYQREGKGVEFYREWDKIASVAWVAAEERISAELKRTIDLLWTSKEKGFELAKAYIDELDDRLAKLHDQLSRWRETHERDYRDSLDEFERLADGEWVIPENTSNINQNGVAGGVGQATPTMGGRTLASTATSSPTGNGTAFVGSIPATHSSSTAYQHLPPREERIARQLEQRIIWLQDQVPSLPTQVTIGTPFLLSTLLSGLALYPHPAPLVAASFTAGTTAIIGVGNWYFWRRYQRKVEEGREDLLKFYRCYYAHQCELREDGLRHPVIGPLRCKAMRIREKLDDIRSFIRDVQRGLDEQARDTQLKLFNSPSSVRDILVANGERLQKQRKNTIEEFAGQITKQRMKEPVEEWHQNPQDMKEMLIESFRQLPESIIEMDDESARQYIYEFTRAVISDYFKGPFVDIQRALDKQDVWREVLDRVQNSFYRAQVGMHDKPELLFVCGREPELAKGSPHLPKGTNFVRMSDHHGWVLVAALFRGGSPTTINPDLLFPYKPTFPPASEDDENLTA
jgi:hypothetical protein